MNVPPEKDIINRGDVQQTTPIWGLKRRIFLASKGSVHGRLEQKLRKNSQKSPALFPSVKYKTHSWPYFWPPCFFFIGFGVKSPFFRVKSIHLRDKKIASITNPSSSYLYIWNQGSIVTCLYWLAWELGPPKKIWGTGRSGGKCWPVLQFGAQFFSLKHIFAREKKTLPKTHPSPKMGPTKPV